MGACSFGATPRSDKNCHSRPRDDYISTILKPSTWGGAIELAILAKHYNTEISSVDVETGRIDRFTPSPEADSGNRSILIYSGIHYDAATLAPIKDAPEDFHQTIMPVRGSTPETDSMLKAAKGLANKLREKKAFTNTSTFTLKCEVRPRALLFVRQHLNPVVGLRKGLDGGEGSQGTRRRNRTCKVRRVLRNFVSKGCTNNSRKEDNNPGLSGTRVRSFYGICSTRGIHCLRVICVPECIIDLQDDGTMVRCPIDLAPYLARLDLLQQPFADNNWSGVGELGGRRGRVVLRTMI